VEARDGREAEMAECRRRPTAYVIMLMPEPKAEPWVEVVG
jgi:hypothetical protein